MEELIAQLKSRRLGISFILKMIPLELLEWKPHPSMRSTLELATHLAIGNLALFETFNGNISDEEAYIALHKNNTPLNAQGLVKLYEEGLTKLITFLEENLEEVHEEKINLFYEKHPSSMYKEVVGELGHQWLHLGQLFTYLKQNEVPVDMGAYYGYKDPDPDIPPNE